MGSRRGAFVAERTDAMTGAIIALATLTVALGGCLVAIRRRELRQMQSTVVEREESRRTGRAKSELLHPVVDLSRCLGCGTCVSACPEEDVLALVHGQAQVVNGSHCVGVAACARECPVGAITVTIADLEERRDIPAVTEDLEAVGRPGLFLAGEVTAHALIRVAIEHGVQAVRKAAERVEGRIRRKNTFDVCIVGAGPAGLAAALEAKRLGLSGVILDQADEPGGTVAKYPRQKLVLTQPVELPLVGALPGTELTKEELMDFWRDAVRRESIRIRSGSVVKNVSEAPGGVWRVETEDGFVLANSVVLAVGRRGVPRKLDVPGEELTKVAYSLMDASSFERQNVLVVGGGDSAVEAALGLAESGTNNVLLSYRREAFFRIKKKNAEKLEHAIEAGRLEVLHKSELKSITEDTVLLERRVGMETETLRFANDAVFILAGGKPPFELLEQAGVSFDPAKRPKLEAPVERGTGLRSAVLVSLVLSFATLLFCLWHSDYYLAESFERPSHALHDTLRPGLGFGLWTGIVSVVLILANLAYLLRRYPRFRIRFGSLEAWMTTHVVTGILAFLCATLHAAFAPRATVGGRAYWALAILLITGAIGRYFYAWIPRKANGKELALEEVKARLAKLSDIWHRKGRAFSGELRDRVFQLVEARQWRGTFFGRVLALAGVRRDLRAVERDLAIAAQRAGLSVHDIAEMVQLTRDAHRTALFVAHYEDLRAILATWRYFHRWVAVGMVLLLIVHVVMALFYGARFFDGVSA